jgi:hypothetical protein
MAKFISVCCYWSVMGRPVSIKGKQKWNPKGRKRKKVRKPQGFFREYWFPLTLVMGMGAFGAAAINQRLFPVKIKPSEIQIVTPSKKQEDTQSALLTPSSPLTFRHVQSQLHRAQEYLDTLLEKEANSSKYFRSIAKLEYHPLVDRHGRSLYLGDDPRTVTLAWVEPSEPGERCTISISPLVFVGGEVESEQELLSVIDNETIHTALRYYRALEWPKFPVTNAKEDGQIKKVLTQTPMSLMDLVHEYHSSMHQLLMISAGKRRVSPYFLGKARETYHEIANDLLKKSYGTEHHERLRLMVDLSSAHSLRAGRVSLPRELFHTK